MGNSNTFPLLVCYDEAGNVVLVVRNFMNSVKNALLDKTEMYEIDLWVITCPLVLFQALLTLLEN